MTDPAETPSVASTEDAERASTAWMQCRVAGRRPPRAVIELADTKRGKAKSAVFRLAGAGPRSEDVVAKCSRPAGIGVERRVLDHLAAYPIDVIRCYGSVDDRVLGSWLFTESVEGDVPDLREGGRDRIGLARWLARLHRVTAGPRPDGLDDLGDGFQGRTRCLARHAIEKGVENPAVGADRVAVLRDTAAAIDRLERCWATYIDALSILPHAVLHGDATGKNMLVDRTTGAVRLFDWEVAGWGPPAIDLHHADIATYCDEVGIGSSAPAEARLAAAAHLARGLVAIEWASRKLAYPHVDKALRDLDVFHRRVTAALDLLEET